MSGLDITALFEGKKKKELQVNVWYYSQCFVGHHFGKIKTKQLMIL